MSSLTGSRTKPGGKPDIELKNKKPPDHSGGRIISTRFVDFHGPVTGDPIKLKLGIRVKAGHTKVILVITKRGTGDELVLTRLPPADPVVIDLTKALGLANDEQWVAYTATWEHTYGVNFDSELTLEPFDSIIPLNGFEIVTVALCHASQTFEKGNYSYAVSVLPGKNSSGFPLNMSLGGGKKHAARGRKIAKAKPRRNAGKKRRR